MVVTKYLKTIPQWSRRVLCRAAGGLGSDGNQRRTKQTHPPPDKHALKVRRAAENPGQEAACRHPQSLLIDALFPQCIAAV